LNSTAWGAYRANGEYRHPETSAWTGRRLSVIVDCSDCPTIGPDWGCCWYRSSSISETNLC